MRRVGRARRLGDSREWKRTREWRHALRRRMRPSRELFEQAEGDFEKETRQREDLLNAKTTDKTGKQQTL